MTRTWQEYERSRSQPIKTSQPAPAAPVVIGNTTYRPLTRYTIIFEVQPDPKDARIAELERMLEAALAQNGATEAKL